MLCVIHTHTPTHRLFFPGYRSKASSWSTADGYPRLQQQCCHGVRLVHPFHAADGNDERVTLVGVESYPWCQGDISKTDNTGVPCCMTRYSIDCLASPQSKTTKHNIQQHVKIDEKQPKQKLHKQLRKHIFKKSQYSMGIIWPLFHLQFSFLRKEHAIIHILLHNI